MSTRTVFVLVNFFIAYTIIR